MTIEQQIAELKERQTAASLDCIHFMSVENKDMKKYLASLKEHVEATKEINRLKKMLNQP